MLKCHFQLFLLTASLRLAAQLPQYHAQVFGAGQGIATGNIHAIFKDRQQFLWIVAGDLLQRFDGRNTLRHEFGSHITQAVCDRDNRIWVMSGGKIFRSCSNRQGFDHLPLDSTAGLPCAIFQLRRQPLCLLTNKGFFDWHEKTGAFQYLENALPPAAFAPGGNRFDTCGTTIFYPGKDCFHAADLASGQVRTLPTSTRFNTFCALTPDLGVISYFDGVSVWLDFANGTVSKIDAVQLGLSDRQRRLNLMDAAPLGDSLFLVTTQFGACTFDLRNRRFARQRIFSEGKPVELEEFLLRIFQDENGTFWAHNTSNLLAFNTIRQTLGLLRNYHEALERRWSSRVVGFAEDGRGDVWFGGFNGFNRLDMRTGQVEPHPPDENATDRLSHVSVRGLAFDGETLILGPTLRGMWLYEPATDRFFRPLANETVRQGMEQEFVNGILPLRNGNFLVCGKPNQYLLQAGSHRLQRLAVSDKQVGVGGACQEPNGRIWLAGGSVVFVLDERGNLLFVKPLTGELVQAVFPISKDSMLLGTDKGLRLLTPASAAGRLVRVGLPLENVSVRQVWRDGRGRFWCCTDDGLYLADAGLRLFRRFDFADNIQSRFYNPFSALRASNGLLFLGGHNGINYFYPESIELEAPPLSVSLQTLSLGDGDSVILRPTTGLVFSHRQNTLTFEVAAPYFNNASKLQFRYRLNANESWVNTNGSHIIRLANLPPASYRLEVAASLAGSKWWAAPPLDFRIRPAWWQTIFFKISAAAACLFLLGFFFRQREYRLKKRQGQALELEKLKSRALQFEVEAAAAKLQSLRLQMNPHFLFNALNSIQELILTGKTDGAATYLSKFSKLLRLVLAHSEQDMASLRDEIELLRLYLHLESLRFLDTFEYSITCAPGLDPGMHRLPTLLVQPFVENAIWHGLLHREGKRHLAVHFETAPGIDGEDDLLCIVEDNGVGRAAAEKLNGKNYRPGKGIRVAWERLQALNSQYGHHNSLEIIDLKAEGGSAAGTRAVIKFRI